jgi:hypothetical protein
MPLDTTFFIDLEDELRALKPGPCVTFLKEKRHLTKHVSVITLGEFSVGASAVATLRFFSGYQRLSLGRDVALFGGRRQAGLPFEMTFGSPLPLNSAAWNWCRATKSFPASLG